MNAKQFIKEFLIYFCLMFVVNIAVTYIWNLHSEGVGSVDWPRSIIFPLIWAFALPIVNAAVINKKSK
jgi:hypothetical protein